MNCSVDGCERQPRPHSVTGPCEMHYYRMRRTGTYDRLNPWHRRGVCSVEGCERAELVLSMCGMHAARVQRHGSPDYIPQAERNMARGERSPHWTGNAASYFAAHQRVVKARGRAAAQTCVDCGANAKQWSYNHAAPDEKIAPEGRYSPDPAQYVPRCVPCHKRHDLDLIAARRAVSGA